MQLRCILILNQVHSEQEAWSRNVAEAWLGQLAAQPAGTPPPPRLACSSSTGGAMPRSGRMRASSSARSRKAENSGQYARGEGPRSERPCGQAAQVCATWPSTAASALASVCSFRLSRLSRRNRPRACRWGRQQPGAREGGLALVCEGGRTRCAAAAPLARCDGRRRHLLCSSPTPSQARTCGPR